MTDIFTPKPFAEISADMIEQVRGTTDKLTDFNVGSVVRTLLEANATELDDYYQAMYYGLLRAIPTAIYLGFGFDIKPAVAAIGTVTITRLGDATQAQTIPAGTSLTSLSGVTYLTDADLILGVGQTSGSVTVTATVAGVSGNTDPGTLTLFTQTTSALTVTNPSSITGGEDVETEEKRAERFAAFVRSLARGTVAALEYGATLPAIYHPTTGLLSERVQRVSVYEEPGHVMLYIHNGSYGASDELVAAVQLLIDGYRDENTLSWVGGYRPAGMRVEVVAMTETPLDVSIEITKRASASAATVTSAVRGALERFVRAAMPNEIIRPIDLINAALAIDGVDAVTVLSPVSSVTVPRNAILYLGDLSITWTV